MKNIHPSKGWVLVEIIKPERKTAQGIVLPESVAKEPMMGKVIEIGRPQVKESGLVEEAPVFDIKDEKGDAMKRRKLKISDVVIYKQHTAHEIVGAQFEKIAFVNFESILGIELDYKEELKS